MERVRGIILRERLPEGLVLAPGQMGGICRSLVDTLVELHAVDYFAAGLDGMGKPDGYVARQVRGWAQRYERSATHDLPDMNVVATWLVDNLPPERGATLIHNDFKLDNLVLDAEELTHVRAVLDWEMATIGDPLMDLGTTLGYWIQEGDPPELQLIGLANFPGSWRRNEVVAHYADASGRNVSGIEYYYVFGLFKLAVIAQQIYYRYHQGITQDARFARLDAVVRACASTARRAARRAGSKTWPETRRSGILVDARQINVYQICQYGRSRPGALTILCNSPWSSQIMRQWPHVSTTTLPGP